MKAPSRHAPRSLIAGALFLLCTCTAWAQTVPAGFEIDVYAQGPALSYLTGIAFDEDGVLHVSQADLISNTGRVLRVEDRDGDGSAETIEEYAGGFGVVTGIAFRGRGFPIGGPRCKPSGHPTGKPDARPLTDLERIRRGRFAGRELDLFVSHFVPGPGGGGSISRVWDADGDGVAEQRDDIVTGLPSDGENGNQQIAVGSDGFLYFGQGGRTNSGVPSGGPPDTPLNGTILRVAPDGSGMGVYADGLRNVFDLVFTRCGELLATENGPDPGGPNPIFDAPDELNAIIEGGSYGWPDNVGFPPSDTGTLGPVALFGPSTSTDGIAIVPEDTFNGYEGDLLAAQFGSFLDPAIGRRIVRIRLEGQRNILVEEFASGFQRPLDVAFGPDGALYVVDFSDLFFSPGSAVIYRIRKP